MGERKEGLYHNFSRKDLQGLCKKYGLPANKSNSEMATSLILYLEKKNISSRTIWEVTRSDPYPSGLSELRAGVTMNTTDDQRKDCREIASHSGSGILRFSDHRDVQQLDLQNCKAPATSDKVFEDVGILTRLHRDSNNGAGSFENAFSSVVSSRAEAPLPTFTFDVSCQDGIQLYVDVNSKPSDWIESMKAGVHMCHDVHNLKSQDFHQEVGQFCCSNQRKGSHKETSNGQLEDGSNPTTMMAGVQPRADDLDGAELSLASPRLKTFSDTVHNQETSGEEHAMLSSRFESDIEGQQCGSESCPRKEEKTATVLDVNVVTQIRTCKSSGKSLLYESECSGFVHEGLNAGDGIYKEAPLQQTYGPQESDSINILASPFANFAQDQNMASSSLKVDTSLDSADQLQNTKTVDFGSINSDQFHADVHKVPPVQAIGQSRFASSSPPMNSLSLDLADRRRKVEHEHATACILSKSTRQISEAQTQLASNRRKRRSFPIQRYQSRDVLNLANSTGTGSGILVSSHEGGRKAIEMQKEDASLLPCSNGGYLDMALPKQYGSDSYILTHSNKLGADIFRSQTTPNVGNLGSSNAADGKESSECLNLVDLVEKPWRKPAYSESNGELKRKGLSDSIEEQSQSVSGSLCLTSRQFAGDVRASRRRSSRLTTK